MQIKYFLLFFLFLSITLHAQEPKLLRWSQVSSPGVENRLIKKGDSFFLNRVGGSYPEINDRISDIEIDSFYTSDNELSGDGVYPRSAMILEYKVGEGFVDYDLVNHCSHIEGFDVDGKNKAFTFESYVTSINSNLYFDASLDTLPGGYDPYNGHHSLAVVDSETDSLLFYERLEDVISAPTGFDDVVLHGDFLYVISYSSAEYNFMGVEQHDYLFQTELGTIHEKALHKVNWKTNELVWTRHFGTIGASDDVLDFRLIQDSMLILALETNGYRYWEGERIDIPEDPDLGYNIAFYKLNKNGELLDYIDADSWSTSFFGANIEDDGSVVVHGKRVSDDPIIFGDTGTFDGGKDDAILGFTDSNWENIWTKSYNGEFTRLIAGANYSVPLDEIMVPIYFLEDISVEGHDFVASHAGESEIPNSGLGDCAFIIYDGIGNPKYHPVVLPLDILVFESHKLSENRYLLYAVHYTDQYLEVFGDRLGEDVNYSTSRFIFEIEGEWFDIINNLDELVKEFHQKVDLFPNPAVQGEWVTIDMKSQSDNLEISFVSVSGNIINIEEFLIENSKVRIKIPTISAGVYAVNIKSENKFYYSKLVIQ
jgi:hypothetical protein